MDGLSRSNELVFVLAATNLPWELDAAMLRRLEKRVSFVDVTIKMLFEQALFVTSKMFYSIGFGAELMSSTLCLSNIRTMPL